MDSAKGEANAVFASSSAFPCGLGISVLTCGLSHRRGAQSVEPRRETHVVASVESQPRGLPREQ